MSITSEPKNIAERAVPNNEPNHLLQLINEHLNAGRIDEAKSLYLHFKERFPDYPIPEYMHRTLTEPASKTEP